MMPNNKNGTIAVSATLNRFYLATIIVGSICIGIEFGWLVGLGVGLLTFSILGGMDEIYNRLSVFDAVNRHQLIDVCEKLSSIDEKLSQLSE